MFVLPAHPQDDGQGAVLPPAPHGPGSPTASPRRRAGGSIVRGEYAVDRGGPSVAPVGGHGSHLIGDLAASNALIVVPEDVTAVSAPATRSQVLRLDEEF